MSSQSDAIPDSYKWSLEIDTGDIMIKHKVTGYYLYGATQSSNPSNVSMRPKYTKGTLDYNRQKWRFVDEDNYVELYDISFYDQVLDKTESILPRMVKAPRSSTWSYAKDFEYTITSGSQYISFNATNYRFTGVAPGTAQVKAVHKTTGITESFEIKVNNTAIIIIPGIMGTRLALAKNEDYIVWGEELADDTKFTSLEKLERLYMLECDENGQSVNDIVPINNKYGAGNTYKDLYNVLLNKYGDMHDIEFFAYDWRLSNSISAQKLNDFIEESDYDEVYLVAHSMGGLVASGYLALGEYQRSKVERLITLGSPLLGTPIAPYLWASEDLFAMGILNEEQYDEWVRKLINAMLLVINPVDAIIFGFSSIYELFPSEKYFDDSYAGEWYLYTAIIGATMEEYIAYEATRNYWDDTLIYSMHLADAAEKFHNSLYIDKTHVSELVDTYYIAGYGVNTIEKVCNNTLVWEYHFNEADLGDSLVLEWSATLGDRQPHRTIYAENVNHMGLIGNNTCLNYISQLIGGNDTIPGNSILSQEINTNN